MWFNLRWDAYRYQREKVEVISPFQNLRRKQFWRESVELGSKNKDQKAEQDSEGRKSDVFLTHGMVHD